ncbi:hypothetical protein E2C01_083725 [Portunus trituberculatus]|uniref:Uncharacterized protein n=1 Tax=Portunus trituberculatus TaxID=210409 RepID=A0A5B7J8S6_PORTR|nr:hypothetical protein [Portunus trituberculatus]
MALGAGQDPPHRPRPRPTIAEYRGTVARVLIFSSLLHAHARPRTPARLSSLFGDHLRVLER